MKNKKVICQNCQSAIDRNAKICPVCGAKNKKPFYKRGWFIVLVILIIFNIYGCAGSRNQDKKETEETKAVETVKETQTPETQAPETQAPETQAPETQAPEMEAPADDLVDGMRPEFKQAMDSYEAFMNEYCDFMADYAESDGSDLKMLADYADMMSKYADAAEDFDAWDDDDLNDAELSYYIEVQTRVNERLYELI